MKKDVIYIDIDDDVTAIIGKVKKAQEKIVVLVPPKRIGALQSAVNLRLLQRMVKADKKHLVLVTNNQALMGLAAAAEIPVAKNLQSKPEVPEVPALIVDDDDDIIDGASIPVGEHAKTAPVKESTARSKAIDDVDLSLPEKPEATKRKVADQPSAKAKKAKSVPDFDTFRKKLFFGIGGGIALIALLVWMFVFAPAATVIITARTSPFPVTSSVQLGGTAATSFEKGLVSSVTQKEEVNATVEFEATGQKNVGEKASGTMRISRLVENDYTVQAGTQMLASGKVFVTTSTVTIPASISCFPSFCAQSVDVGVAAIEGGSSYNGISGSASNSAGVTGAFRDTTAGGTDKIARVVTKDDIERAKGKLIGESTDKYKDEIRKKFTDTDRVIDSSFDLERGDVKSTPAVDQEATDSKAELSMKLTLSMSAVREAELESFLKQAIESKFEEGESQRVFDAGAKEATLGDYREENGVAIVTLNATGRVGPKIDELAIKEEAAGKRYGDIQSVLESREGIQEVDVKFSYFWVRTVPNNVDKITVEFKVEDE